MSDEVRDPAGEGRKYEALYAEAREALCSCNHTDTPEKGPLYDYTCEWCKAHPDGAEPPPIIKELWAAETRVRDLENQLAAVAICLNNLRGWKTK